MRIMMIVMKTMKGQWKEDDERNRFCSSPAATMIREEDQSGCISIYMAGPVRRLQVHQTIKPAVTLLTLESNCVQANITSFCVVFVCV